MKKYTTIQKVNDSEFIVTDYEQINKQKTIKIKFSTIILIVILLIAVIFFSVYIKTAYDSGKPDVTSYQTTAYNSLGNYPFSSDGFLFPTSNTQYLTKNDIDELRAKAIKSNYSYQELLRFSINEIYARRGFLFSGGKFERFYCQYQWYIDVEKVEVVSWDKFNNYEQQNIALLVNEEKQNGFR